MEGLSDKKIINSVHVISDEFTSPSLDKENTSSSDESAQRAVI